MDIIHIVEETSQSTKSEMMRSCEIINRRVQSLTDVIKTVQNNMKLLNTKHSADKQDPTSAVNVPADDFQPPDALASHDVSGIPDNTPSQQLPSLTTNSSKRTLLIGDSILRDIQSRGLKKTVDIHSISGGRVNHVRDRFFNMDFTDVSDVIMYTGGNDVADGRFIQSIREQLERTVNLVKSKTAQCNIYICTVCLRRDVDVSSLNHLLITIATELQCTIIDYKIFTFGNGSTVRYFYNRDGIHLNPKGTSTLLRAIDKTVSVIKPRALVQTVDNGCGSRNTDRSDRTPTLNQQNRTLFQERRYGNQSPRQYPQSSWQTYPRSARYTGKYHQRRYYQNDNLNSYSYNSS